MRIPQLLELLKSDSNDPFLHHALGMEYIAVAENDQAEAAFRQAIAVSESYTASYYQLGLLLADCGKADEAISILKQGLMHIQSNPKTEAEFRQAILNIEMEDI